MLRLAILSVSLQNFNIPSFSNSGSKPQQKLQSKKTREGKQLMKVFSNNFHHWLSFERKAVGKVEGRWGRGRCNFAAWLI